MAILKTNSKVEIVQPNITGTILKAVIVDDEVQYLVDYLNDEGENHQRWFVESKLTPVND